MLVSHLESPIDGSRFPPGQVYTTHLGRPLLVRYRLDEIARRLRPADLASRPPTLWRYRELLPLPADAEPVCLGEHWTPLLPCPRLGRELGLERLWIKDEAVLPTGSFKARGMALAVSMARYFGLQQLAVPSAGNAGGALAAYGARAGCTVHVFMPQDAPRSNQVEAQLYGARVYLVRGLISDCGRLVRQGVERWGWFDVSTMKEPYRLEGKKTMGLELVEQLGWRVPDVLVYPTGGGTGLVGMWKAFQELRQLGWLAAGNGPRLIGCQSEGCAPLVRAFQTGQRFAEPVADPQTRASGLRVPAALGDFLILEAVRSSGGCLLAGRESAILPWMQRVAALEGIAICPETALCFDCLAQLRAQGRVQPQEEVVVFNTAAAQKYADLFPLHLPVLEKDQPLS
jgi:threonine synthase